MENILKTTTSADNFNNFCGAQSAGLASTGYDIRHDAVSEVCLIQSAATISVSLSDFLQSGSGIENEAGLICTEDVLIRRSCGKVAEIVSMLSKFSTTSQRLLRDPLCVRMAGH